LSAMPEGTSERANMKIGGNHSSQVAPGGDIKGDSQEPPLLPEATSRPAKRRDLAGYLLIIGSCVAVLLSMIAWVGALREDPGTDEDDSVGNSECAAVHEFFAGLSIRSLDGIFKSDHVLCTLIGETKLDAKWLNWLVWLRCGRAVGVVAGAALNMGNIFVQFGRSVPTQLQVAARIRAGLFLQEFWRMANGDCVSTKPSLVEHNRTICHDFEVDMQNSLLLVLVWSELVMVMAVACLSFWGLSALWSARTDVVSGPNSSRWRWVARGFDWLELIPSVSTMKILPQVKNLPNDAISKYKLKKKKLTEDDGEYSTADRAIAISYLLLLFGQIVLVTIGGIFALHLKMESLAFLSHQPIGRWGRDRWLPFIGFANQIAGIVPFGQLRKHTIMFFVFTGEDAEMSPKEHTAMEEFNAMLCKHIFKYCGNTLAFIILLGGLSNVDLQKILITESKRGH